MWYYQEAFELRGENVVACNQKIHLKVQEIPSILLIALLKKLCTWLKGLPCYFEQHFHENN